MVPLPVYLLPFKRTIHPDTSGQLSFLLSTYAIDRLSGQICYRTVSLPCRAGSSLVARVTRDDWQLRLYQNAPGRTRTCNLRIRRPLPENSKSCDYGNLQRTQKGAYKPAYKNFPKTVEGRPPDMRETVIDDILGDIVAGACMDRIIVYAAQLKENTSVLIAFIVVSMSWAIVLRCWLSSR